MSDSARNSASRMLPVASLACRSRRVCRNRAFSLLKERRHARLPSGGDDGHLTPGGQALQHSQGVLFGFGKARSLPGARLHAGTDVEYQYDVAARRGLAGERRFGERRGQQADEQDLQQQRQVLHQPPQAEATLRLTRHALPQENSVLTRTVAPPVSAARAAPGARGTKASRANAAGLSQTMGVPIVSRISRRRHPTFCCVDFQI